MEERRERLCKLVIVIRVLFILCIFVALFIANHNNIITDEVFMGLSLLTLLMPDIVLVIFIIVGIANAAMTEQSASVNTQASLPQYSATSSDQPAGNLKYSLTSTPDVFN